MMQGLVFCVGVSGMLLLAAAASRIDAQGVAAPPDPSQTGVITGVVTDGSGAPLVGVRVQAVVRRQRWLGPYYAIPTGKPVETDDRGRFRLFFLPPDRYAVAVLPQPTPSAVTLPAPPPPPGHLRTYAPGTTALADAEMVDVVAAEERSVAIRVTPARVMTISGLATTADGQPAADFEIWLHGTSTALDYAGVHRGFTTPVTAAARTATDGSFTLSRVPSGRYTATVTNGRTRRDQPLEIAEIPIEITDSAITDLTVRTAPGATVSGRLEWAGHGSAPWPRSVETLGRLQATAIRRDDDFASLDADVQPDGTFRFTGLYGARRIEALSLPLDWAIESVRGPQGIFDGPNLIVTPGTDITDVRVVVTDRLATLRALVVDEADTPFETGSFLLMPRDPADFDALGWGFRTTQKNQERQGVWYYTMDRVLPGSYLAAAIDAAPFHLIADAELMERTRAMATPIEVREGETSLRLRVVRLLP